MRLFARKGLHFRDCRAFIAFVRMTSFMDEGAYTLYQLTPASEESGGFLLTGHAGQLPPGSPGQPVSFRQWLQRLTWEAPGGRRAAHIAGQRCASTLLDLVDLEPAANETDVVVFRCPDVDRFHTLAVLALRLHNDHLHYTVWQAASGTSKHYLLRIQQPSWFLLQRYHEDHPEIAIYAAQGEKVWVAWGYRHPLGDLLAARTRDDPYWRVCEADGCWRALLIPQWLDVYPIADFVTAPTPTVCWLQTDAPPPAFQVALHLVRQTRPVAPELWIVPEAAQSQLEDQLAVLPQEALQEYLFTRQILPASGEGLLLIRRRRGNPTEAIPFSGRGFAPYKGIAGLLLPVDFDLRPPVRRDVYLRLFAVTGGQTTLVDGDETQLTVLRVHEAVFRPLIELVDYLIQSEIQDLDARLARSVFELGDYWQAPPPVIGVTKQTPSDRPTPEASTEPAPPPGTDVKPSNLDNTALNIDEVPEEPPSQPDIPLSSPEERELEGQLIHEGPSFTVWRALGQVKRALGKIRESLVCAIQAWWLAPTAEDVASLRDFIRANTSVLSSEQGQLFQVVFGSDIVAAATLLRRHEQDHGLTLKERWLLWTEIVRRNQDVRQLAEVREAIRQQLATAGLGIDQIPGFLRERLYEEHQVQTGDLAALRHGERNLERVHATVNGLGGAAIRPVGCAIVAYAHARLSGQAPDTPRPASGVPDIQAWYLLYAAHAAQEAAPDRARALHAEWTVLLRSGRLFSQEELQEAERTLAQREQLTDPAAFLGQQNRARLFPTIADPGATRPVMTWISTLDAALANGDTAQAATLLRQTTRFVPADFHDEIEVPRFVQALNHGVACLRGVLPELDQTLNLRALANRLADFSFPHTANPFYTIIRYAALAEGLAGMQHFDEAETQLRCAIHPLQSLINPPLDYIDGAAMVVNVIERFPLDRRYRLLNQLLPTFATVAEAVDEDGPLFILPVFSKLVRLLDQIATAAISRDQLSLAACQAYLLADEYLILQRILTEDPTTTSLQ